MPPPPLPRYRPGQVWTIRNPEKASNVRLTILKVETNATFGAIVHVAVTGLNLPNGSTTISHMPFAEGAIERSVKELVRTGGPVPDFSEGYAEWRKAHGGIFTVEVAEAIAALQTGISSETSPPKAPPPLLKSQEEIAAINRQFAEFAEGEIDPLEGALTAFHLNRDRYFPQVIAALGEAWVTLLLRENNPHSPPLLLQSIAGYPMLPIFTGERRTVKCQEQFPEYCYRVRAPFAVTLERLWQGVGLVINPYVEVITWEMAPTLVDILKPMFPIDTKQPPLSPPR